ncbi:uncharacterized protein B0P05DRAFT_247294 [Gilbertella persicaria]|uniref:uncharacterized protein n=1 Tax=Gilbertella persicaria TaxID=101096 RepID=UPI00221F998B|nr:uncharacterized protein B0P05DRAFT_247294 [Gilbertella persicaria]KAI8062368.1 hypothetical protein B0P05DRAFT_247294 [Gilbertella persicaria]
MLTDDELDFDDFGDLGEVEGTELTTEELEKQLELEFDTGEKEQVPEKSETKEHEKKQGEESNDGLEPGEQVSSNETFEKKSSPKPYQQKQPHYQQKPFYNNRYNNFYPPNQYKFIPDAMALNQMYAQFPPFSNRIYVNPKFNQGTPQQMMHRQMMEMEAQRMLMMQQQSSIDLDKKRQETAEMMRKRREAKEKQPGEKRSRAESDEDRATKRQQIPKPSPAGGISIKGVAAARGIRSSSPPPPPPPPRNVPYTPPLKQQHATKPSIMSRLSQPDKPSSVPIATQGKSSTLVIKGFDSSVTKQDIINLTKNVPGELKDIQFNGESKEAIITFSTVEAAVTFRRKYNRSQIGQQHITVVFQK